MEIASNVIPNEDNNEEDLSRCDPNYLPLPAVSLGNGVWLARWTLNEDERRIVAETGDVYIRMHAVDGDEMIMAHRLFVERPNLTSLRAAYLEKKQQS